MSLNVTLVVVGGDVKTPEVKLRLPSTVGRGRDCSIMLRHPLVSRQHCEIFEASGTLLVRDLGSLNGTFVNNQRIEGDAPLQPGQLLTIGTVTFRAMYDPAASDGAPPTTPPPQLKQNKPSSDTDAEGTSVGSPDASGSRETLRAAPPSFTPPTEPIDDGEFDLGDAKPLFAEVDDEQTSENVNAKAKANSAKPVPPKSNAETVRATGKPKPPTPAPVPPAQQPAAAAPASKPAEAPAFDFLANDEAGGQNEDDDDLNDFLKNLK